MATLIQGKWLGSSAKQSVLESKLVALRNAVLNFSAESSSSVVTPEIISAATTDVARTDLLGMGIYAGAVSGASDPLKVLIRASGTDNGIDDGTGDEIFGVLSEDTEVFTLSFKKADGSAYSFASATPIDFYFVEVFNEYNKPVNSHLLTSIGGVIDATSSSAIAAHINSASDAHDASAISVLDTANNFVATDVEAALAEAMDAAQAAQSDATQAIADAAAAQSDATQAIADAADAQADATQALTNISNHISNATGAHAASAISIVDTAEQFTSTDVEGALAEAIDAAQAAQSTANGAVSSIGTLAASPTNYTPTEATVSGHLQGIDSELAALTNGVVKPAAQILTVGSDKFLDLASPIAATSFNVVSLVPVGGPEQEYTVCFTAANDGPAGVGRVTWDGLGLDGVLVSGDKVIIRYPVAST
jgi:hypothetical protein